MPSRIDDIRISSAAQRAREAALPDLDRVLNRLTNHGEVSTLPTVELGVLGPLQVRLDGAPVAIPGAKPRAVLTMLGLHSGSVVSADTLVELLWGDDPPRTASKALQTHISSLRNTLGDGFVLTEGTGWTLHTTQIDASHYKLAARMGRDAIAAGDTSEAMARFEAALASGRASRPATGPPRPRHWPMTSALTIADGS